MFHVKHHLVFGNYIIPLLSFFMTCDYSIAACINSDNTTVNMYIPVLSLFFHFRIYVKDFLPAPFNNIYITKIKISSYTFNSHFSCMNFINIFNQYLFHNISPIVRFFNIEIVLTANNTKYFEPVMNNISISFEISGTAIYSHISFRL